MDVAGRVGRPVARDALGEPEPPDDAVPAGSDAAAVAVAVAVAGDVADGPPLPAAARPPPGAPLRTADGAPPDVDGPPLPGSAPAGGTGRSCGPQPAVAVSTAATAAATSASRKRPERPRRRGCTVPAYPSVRRRSNRLAGPRPYRNTAQGRPVKRLRSWRRGGDCGGRPPDTDHVTSERTVGVTELALRDAHQSLMATRMSMADMVGACEDIDNAGYWSVECWGGATFDACIRFLNEDPWERLRTFRRLLPNSRLQMLLRGQNLLGYRHYGDGVVDRFVEKSAENGMDVFRVFDALNDVRNIERALRAVKRVGKHAQGTICYTVSPLHDVAGYVQQARELADMGADSLCLKDMAALLKPQPASDIISAIKAALPDMQLSVHCHATSGVTLVSLMKAIEAGADVVDTAISSLSLGPGHNPTESLQEMLEGTGFVADLDKARLRRIKDHFAAVKPRYARFMSSFTVDTTIFDSQIPGGMISNMESQLKQQGAGEKLREVLDEVPRVRRDAGYPPLVTPSSQIVGTQAVFNVLMGRYKVLTAEFSDLLLGYYGYTLGPKNPEVAALATKQAGKEPITGRPADLIAPEWDALRAAAERLDGFDGTDEDVLTYAMFPKVAPSFFATRADGPASVAEEPAPPAQAADGRTGPVRDPVKYAITVNGRTHSVSVTPA